jgi:hypothetical protein
VKYVLELKGNSLRGGGASDIHLANITVNGTVSGAVMFSNMSYKGQTGPYTPR